MATKAEKAAQRGQPACRLGAPGDALATSGVPTDIFSSGSSFAEVVLSFHADALALTMSMGTPVRGQ
ncbi:hypothetical protein [Bradyrhizobium genosp. P]|uniref:hypothetical protein n=1 Tax=Bradyrhizobium genosp. P TaxID=83641 RepID=UPI003CF52F90